MSDPSTSGHQVDAKWRDFQILPNFTTLVGRFQLRQPCGWLEPLLAMVLEREKSEPSIDYANCGGWHSGANLLDWQGEPIGALRQAIAECLTAMVQATSQLPEAQPSPQNARGGFRISAWANVARQGNYHRLHNHPGSSWSGCLYLTGSTDQSLAGVLELNDPRPFTEMVSMPHHPCGQRFLVRPQPGLLVIFPSWVYHFVHPSTSSDPRVSIAFNAQWLPQP
jgi:uncharacterized protein (TIGR02466 family)